MQLNPLMKQLQQQPVLWNKSHAAGTFFTYSFCSWEFGEASDFIVVLEYSKNDNSLILWVFEYERMKFCSEADKKNTVLPTSVAQRKAAGNDKKWVQAVN